MKSFFSVLFFCAAIVAGSAEISDIRVVLTPFREAELAARIDCTVMKHTFRVGERFKAGDVLIKMDDTRLKIDVLRAQAKAAEAAVMVKFAKQRFEAQKELFEENLQSKLELERQRTELESALARKQIADADFSDAKVLFSYCQIKAPYAGRIEKIHCREHESVRVGQPLVKIIDDSQLLAVTNIPLALRKPVGATLKMRFGEKKIPASGKILEISPQADSRSGTIEVKVLVPNPKRELTAGMVGFLEADK
jgi:RND family efflux transporter MFP subunit